MYYFTAFCISLLLAAVSTPIVKRVALRHRLVDEPSVASERKVHRTAIPLGGGVAVFLSFFITLTLLAFFGALPVGIIANKHFFAIFFSGLLLMVAGWIDDRRGLSPAMQFSLTVVATLLVVSSGIGIRELTNPFGGKFSLVWNTTALPGGFMLKFPSDLLTIGWLLLAMYTTKLLDGLDGLVTGIGIIGAATLFGVSLLPQLRQPQVAVVSAAVAGAMFGFLPYNWHPAKIFLGNGGSLLVGFLLGVIAIASGGKFVTLLMLLVVPIFDLLWVVFRRVVLERHSPFTADRKHFHYRLLDVGLSHRQAVLVLWIASASAGLAALSLQMRFKVYALAVLLLSAAIVAVGLVRVTKRNQRDQIF